MPCPNCNYSPAPVVGAGAPKRRVKKGGFLPLLPLAAMAAPAILQGLSGLMGKGQGAGAGRVAGAGRRRKTPTILQMLPPAPKRLRAKTYNG